MSYELIALGPSLRNLPSHEIEDALARSPWITDGMSIPLVVDSIDELAGDDVSAMLNKPVPMRRVEAIFGRMNPFSVYVATDRSYIIRHQPGTPW
ncbi:hypothetical protein J3P71_03985 [Rhizobium leguminosarum]|uniref:hypothetical protein n=1 Tax=Rhizobium leguminosarum TaxID=384 RepID=UPI0014415F84|nr:hypothetical protein [Rhizobium leguminosarum]MBY5841424.1 hypothetical protein [Rhizobium leguminosarum]NKM81419.1 hypothetical protein [Rhizobium leguminosarum bv. viciae]QSZ08947.1 hypothetical protein J3P71_03985 [Rhizobium leguminosarum]